MRCSLFCLLAAFPLASCGAEPPICKIPPAPVASIAVPAPPPSAAQDAVPPPRNDGRLPPFAAPVRYTAALDIDPNQPRFSGTVQILVDVPEPTSFVVLHARDIAVTRAAALIAGGSIGATATPRLAEGGKYPSELVLHFERPVPKGQATLEIVYDAPFSKDLNGIYRVKEGERHYAFTQFEATDARRAFPCFDEPGFKVPWTLTLRVPEDEEVFANTPVSQDRKIINDKNPLKPLREVAFQETKPLPSYLISFAVGPFDVVEVGKIGKNKTPARIITPKGRAAWAEYAAKNTEELLFAIEDYTGIPYPFEKL